MLSRRVGGLWLLAAAMLLLAGTAHAQAEDKAVQVLAWWPEHPTKSFFPGKKASCVLGVKNVGSDRFNVSYAFANLASPYNASMNLFNFTGAFLGDVALGPGEETSAEYTVFFPRALPPREFILQVNLLTSAGGGYAQRLFFNETINVIEEPTWFDTQLIGLYLFGLALLSLAGYFGLEFARSKGFLKKSKKPVVRTAATSSNKEEWLKGTAADPKLRKKQ